MAADTDTGCVLSDALWDYLWDYRVPRWGFISPISILKYHSYIIKKTQISIELKEMACEWPNKDGNVVHGYMCVVLFLIYHIVSEGSNRTLTLECLHLNIPWMRTHRPKDNSDRGTWEIQTVAQCLPTFPMYLQSPYGSRLHRRQTAKVLHWTFIVLLSSSSIIHFVLTPAFKMQGSVLLFQWTYIIFHKLYSCIIKLIPPDKSMTNLWLCLNRDPPDPEYEPLKGPCSPSWEPLP